MWAVLGVGVTWAGRPQRNLAVKYQAGKRLEARHFDSELDMELGRWQITMRSEQRLGDLLSLVIGLSDESRWRPR